MDQKTVYACILWFWYFIYIIRTFVTSFYFYFCIQIYLHCTFYNMIYTLCLFAFHFLCFSVWFLFTILHNFKDLYLIIYSPGIYLEINSFVPGYDSFLLLDYKLIQMKFDELHWLFEKTKKSWFQIFFLLFIYSKT